MQQNFEYAGNLTQEMEEAGRLVPDKEDMELNLTTTSMCSAFLTIYCC